MKRAALLGAVACALGAASPALAAGPAPLSADHSRVGIASTYGSGIFGSWGVDRFGLPAYRYTIDEEKAPEAKQSELNGKTDAWHQVGNDHIVADAFNHGYVQLWSQDRLYQWMNHYDAAHQHYAGGFGYLNVGGKVISTLYDDRPANAQTTRTFGVGYYGKSLSVPGLEEKDTVYAPFGDDSTRCSSGCRRVSERGDSEYVRSADTSRRGTASAAPRRAATSSMSPACQGWGWTIAPAATATSTAVVNDSTSTTTSASQPPATAAAPAAPHSKRASNPS